MTKMDQVKSEINVNDDEYIDVSGEDPEIQNTVASDPHIMRTTRFRRPRRPVEATPYTPYSRRIITRNAHQQLAEDLDDNFEEEIVEEAEEESRMFNNPEIEEEIACDVALVQRARTKRFNRDDEYSDFGPVQFRFDSTQRKKQVIVYNSMKFPGHASEWYFARRNNTTANETYRCVQCRRYREEFKKGIRQDVENLPEARIVVQNDRFLTDPDEPLGKHICDFENNDRTTLQSVWSRRALSKANSELRLRPEKPKEKFNQLLREIQNGKDYAHLPVNVRQAIINELDSKKGFASRRRSFARNNRFGQMQTVGPIKDGIMRGGVYGEIMYYSCGMDGCKERFDSPEERKQHRNYYHSNVLFIDTKEELDEYNNYRRLHSNFVSGEELIVANEQVVREDQIKNEASEPYQEVIIDDEEGENFYHQSCYAIESLRNSAIALVNDPAKRETMLALINDCERSCREIAQSVIDEEVVEQNPESKLPEEAIEEVETFPFKLLFSRVLRMVNRKILCVAEKNDAAKNIAIILSNSTQVFRNGPAQYNKLYCFDTVMLGQPSSVVFTSVSGHLKQIDFPSTMKAWERVPISSCFDAQITSYVPNNMKPIEEQLKNEVRNAHALIVWTDCDREGEHIGGEIVEVCRSVRPTIPVYRARFSEITRQAVTTALNRLVQMNQNEINAVSCRMELDLRIGAAFTRLQTLLVQRQVPNALNGTQDRIVSYGSCQFPTMGFVVYRYLEHVGFAPENFWKLLGRDLDEKIDFTWLRQRLFDEQVVRMYLDICVGNNPTARATVTQVTRTPKTKYRPVAMDTVALEKLGVRKLRMTARRVLAAAEKLYTQGYISYPRTETTIFPPDLQLDNLVQLQTANQEWGQFAADILQRGPATPRNGNKSDGAHPPLHPVKPANKSAITNNDEWRVYELVVRHFLACCSRDARGHETKVHVKVNGETFYTAGLAIEDRGYLLVYPYDRWSDKEIPNYQEGNIIKRFEVKMGNGTTTAPPLLTEADLIALMDRHGIGTDATHAEHIEKIQQRNYVVMTNDRRFRPTFMGMALVDGYNRMGQELLSRPELRSGLETELVDIVEGRRTKEQVLENQLRIYRRVFTIAERNIENLTISLNHFMHAMPN